MNNNESKLNDEQELLENIKESNKNESDKITEKSLNNKPNEEDEEEDEDDDESSDGEDSSSEDDSSDESDEESTKSSVNNEEVKIKNETIQKNNTENPTNDKIESKSKDSHSTRRRSSSRHRKDRSRSRSRHKKSSSSTSHKHHRSHKHRHHSSKRDRHHHHRDRHDRDSRHRRSSRSRHHKHSSSKYRSKSPSKKHRSRSRDRNYRSSKQVDVTNERNVQVPVNTNTTTLSTVEESKDLTISDLLKDIELPRHLRAHTQEALKYQAEQLRKKTEEITGVKVPTYYNASSINPLAYAEQQRKRKLLWSKAKDNDNTSTNIVGKAIVESQDEKTAQKFRKLMGIRNDDEQNNVTHKATEDLSKMQQKAFDALDKEYAFARMATHTHRGMGLGFVSHLSNNQQQSQQK